MEYGRIVCVLVLILPQVSCHENSEAMFSQIDDIHEEMADMRSDMSRLEEKIIRKIDFAKASLRSKLKQHIKRQVREAMAEILQGEDIEEMVRSQIVSEVRKLKHGHHQMKRQIQEVVKSLREVQEERKLYKDSLLKAEGNASEFLMCSQYVVVSKILQRDLEQCDKEINERNIDNQELIRNMISLNETCKLRLETLNVRSGVTSHIEPESTSVVTTTPRATTPAPGEERSRIVVAPYWYKQHQQFRQLNIHNNNLNNYPYLSLKYVTSLAYVSKLKKLLIGLRFPDKIISSNWGRYGVKPMWEGVSAYGMAVDEDRELVFMTTYLPRKSVSRMTTHGKHFTTISYLTNDSIPFALAIDSKEEKIYVCDSSTVFAVSYDGRYVQTLATGRGILALTLDNTAGILYYNDEKTLMKLSLSSTAISNVTTLSVKPRSFVYHNDTVYFSDYAYSDTHTIRAVRVGYEIVPYTVKAVSDYGGYALLICFVP